MVLYPQYYFKNNVVAFIFYLPVTLNKLPIKLCNFYKQALDVWKLIYKHNYSPHSCVIWNNQYILFKNKTIFWSDWFNKGLIFVTDLLNQSGNLYNHTECISNSQLNLSSSEYRKLINFISPKLLHLIKTENIYMSVTGSLSDLTVGGLSIKDKQFNNFYIRNILTRENSILLKAIMKWKQMYPSLLLQNPWSDMNKYVIPNKAKETHFKISHRYYPCNDFISKFKEGFSSLCCFCKEESETIFQL